MTRDATRPSRRRQALLWSLGAGIALVAAAPAAFVAFQPVQVLPRMGLAPGFSFTDQRGERLASDDLKGGITLYAFTYGGCGTRCAGATELFAEVRRRLDETAVGDIPVRMIQVSLDPEGDDLAALAASTGADGPHGPEGPDGETWRLATADTAQLRTVVGSGFETWHVREADGSITFDPTLVIADQLGIKRARYRYQVPSADDVLLRIRELAKEARATGAAHLAYEAAHLFSCYTDS